MTTAQIQEKIDKLYADVKSVSVWAADCGITPAAETITTSDGIVFKLDTKFPYVTASGKRGKLPYESDKLATMLERESSDCGAVFDQIDSAISKMRLVIRNAIEEAYADAEWVDSLCAPIEMARRVINLFDWHCINPLVRDEYAELKKRFCDHILRMGNAAFEISRDVYNVDYNLRKKETVKSGTFTLCLKHSRVYIENPTEGKYCDTRSPTEFAFFVMRLWGRPDLVMSLFTGIDTLRRMVVRDKVML